MYFFLIFKLLSFKLCAKQSSYSYYFENYLKLFDDVSFKLHMYLLK